MIYNITIDLILFRPLLKLININNCKAILYFIQMGLFLIYQGGWDLGGLSDTIRWERSYWFSTPGQFIVGFCFCWNYFFTKKITRTLAICYCNQYKPPHPKSTMSSPVIKITKGMKEKKRIKTKIGVGYVVKANIGDME